MMTFIYLQIIDEYDSINSIAFISALVSLILFIFACYNMSKIFLRIHALKVHIIYTVENNGFEPLTPCVQSRCSSQLS